MGSEHPLSLLPLASLLALLALPAGALAGGGDAARFEKLGKNAYARERWDDAVAAFEAAYEADPQPRYLFNAGRSYERKGDLARAMEYVTRYLALAPTEEDRRDAQAALVLIEKKLVKERSEVRVSSEPSGARVELRPESGEVVRGRTPYRGWLTFGRWEVRVTLEGREPAARTVEVEQGRPAEVSVALERPAAPAEEPAVEPEPAPPPVEELPAAAAVPEAVVQRQDAKTQRRQGGWEPWAVAGGGAVALAAGGVLGWLSASAESERDRLREEVVRLEEAGSQQAAIRSEDESARSRALAANVLYVAGGLAAAAGAAWLLLSVGEGEAAGVGVEVRPGGLSLTWRGGP